MSIATYTKSGTKATTAAKLDKAVFGVEVKSHELLKQAYVAYLSNGRVGSANVKNRGDVRGGGRKPWKQKGTGRARFGSSRVPLWRGGGVVFGPTGEENYTKKMPTNTKRLAIRQALSVANEANKVSVIEVFAPKDGKTSEAAKLLAKVGAERRTLIVTDNKTPEIVRATSNIQNVKVSQGTYLNVYDVLNADMILFTTAGLKATTAWLNAETKKEETK
jgi:large subunit ribosomal protein L4